MCWSSLGVSVAHSPRTPTSTSSEFKGLVLKGVLSTLTSGHQDILPPPRHPSPLRIRPCRQLLGGCEQALPLSFLICAVDRLAE